LTLSLALSAIFSPLPSMPLSFSRSSTLQISVPLPPLPFCVSFSASPPISPSRSAHRPVVAPFPIVALISRFLPPSAILFSLLFLSPSFYSLFHCSLVFIPLIPSLRFLGPDHSFRIFLNHFPSLVFPALFLHFFSRFAVCFRRFSHFSHFFLSISAHHSISLVPSVPILTALSPFLPLSSRPRFFLLLSFCHFPFVDPFSSVRLFPFSSVPILALFLPLFALPSLPWAFFSSTETTRGPDWRVRALREAPASCGFVSAVQSVIILCADETRSKSGARTSRGCRL
jgi:hypothetical protein